MGCNRRLFSGRFMPIGALSDTPEPKFWDRHGKWRSFCLELPLLEGLFQSSSVDLGDRCAQISRIRDFFSMTFPGAVARLV